MNDYIRINTERPHIYSPDIHVGVSVCIDTLIKDGDIRRALKVLQHRHPLLGTTIHFDEENVAYYKLGTANDIEPIIANDNDAIPWSEWITESNKEPFNLTKDSMMRVYVSKDNTTTTITALGHHLLGDGLSFIYFLRDFLFALDNQLDDAVLKPEIIQDETYLPKSGRLGLVRRLFVSKLNRHYKKDSRHFSYDEYHNMYKKKHELNKPQIIPFVLSPQDTSIFINNCKGHGITVNEAITTAFIFARGKALVQSNKLGIACDIRGDMKTHPQEGMGNYVSGFNINVGYNTSISFWENAKIIGAAINAKLRKPKQRYAALSFLNALDDTLIDSIHFLGINEYNNSSSQELCDILSGGEIGEGLAISNLGRIRINTTSFKTKEVYFIPPLFAPQDMTAGIITSNGTLTMTVRYPKEKYSEHIINGIIHTVKSLLITNNM